MCLVGCWFEYIESNGVVFFLNYGYVGDTGEKGLYLKVFYSVDVYLQTFEYNFFKVCAQFCGCCDWQRVTNRKGHVG